MSKRIIMKYKGSIEVNKPRELVVKCFENPDFAKEYQDGYVRQEVIEGDPGTDGSKTTLFYKYGSRDMILEETIVANKLPDTFEAFYHHTHMDNTMKCTFTALEENKTLYEYEFEYTRIAWVMPRLMAILFPGMYRRQGEKWMRQFKEAVEKLE